jgi:hypothetical protein
LSLAEILYINPKIFPRKKAFHKNGFFVTIIFWQRFGILSKPAGLQYFWSWLNFLKFSHHPSITLFWTHGLYLDFPKMASLIELTMGQLKIYPKIIIWHVFWKA